MLTGSVCTCNTSYHALCWHIPFPRRISSARSSTQHAEWWNLMSSFCSNSIGSSTPPLECRQLMSSFCPNDIGSSTRLSGIFSRGEILFSASTGSKFTVLFVDAEFAEFRKSLKANVLVERPDVARD